MNQKIDYATMKLQDLPWEDPFMESDQMGFHAEETVRLDLMVPVTRGIMMLAARGILTGWQVAYLAHLEERTQAGATTTMKIKGPEWNRLVDLGIIGMNPEPGPGQADLVNRAQDWNWKAIKEGSKA